jgi:Xaa-Pro dipeptidase
MFSLDAAKAFMRREGIDAWLLCDFRGSNPIFWHVFGRTRSTTRRAFLMIPRDGAPILLGHSVDQDAFRDAIFEKTFYRSWTEMHDQLSTILRGKTELAIEYSSEGSIPTVAWVDAGTVELLRSWGHRIVSSADLFQVSAAAWDDLAIDSHKRACPLVSGIKDAAFDLIRHALKNGRSITEYDVQQYIAEEFVKHNLETEDVPIVAVNSHSGDPHYEPRASSSAQIRDGDWLLIDLWARFPGENNVFSDITWVAYAGATLPPHFGEVFDVVRGARDKAVELLKSSWAEKRVLQGWEVDKITRDYIAAAGFGDFFVHRTGHSIGPGKTLHALGVNIDNLETKDTRLILPRVGFSIEPGIYLPEFGVRLEINVFIDPVAGPITTTPIQTEVILLGD